MKRRTMLKASGALGATAVGGVGATMLTGSAEATATSETDVSTVLKGTSDSGLVAEIELWTTGSVEWEGLDAPAAYIDINLDVKGPDGEYHRIAAKRFENVPEETSSSTPFEYDQVGGDLFANTDWTSEDFSATEDGSKRKSTVDVRVTSVVCGSDGKAVEDSDEHTVKVKITNLDAGSNLDSDVDGNVTMAEPKGSDCTTCE